MIEKTHTIGFFDVDFKFNLTVEATARLFQDMATSHSSIIGAGQEFLFENGVVWFLHRLEMEFVKYPILGDEIQMSTWHRGFKRYKGFREYLMKSSDGEPLVKGSSVWIFFDLKKNRISKIPEFISQQYESCDNKLFDSQIDAWKACGKINPESTVETDLRYSDFDINGHVNNTVYIGLLENLYHSALKGSDEIPIRNIKIRYNREIDRSKRTVLSAWEEKKNRYQCNIFDKKNLYADGQIITAK